MSDQHRIETAADNCEVLRARLARYEDGDGKPITTIAEQAREIERLQLTCNDLDGQNDRIYAELAALKAQPSGVVHHNLIEALKFYANGDHLLLADPDAWDTCSGEPINFLHDDAGTASVEDGSIAKAALDSLNSSPVSSGDPEKCSYQDDPRSPAELSLAGCNCVRFGEGNPHWPCKLHTPVISGVVDERAAFETWYLGHFYMGDKQCGLEWLSTEPCGGYRHQHPAEQWIVWQARAALSANHSEQARHMVPAWNLAADELPASGKTVLAFYLNSHGMKRRIRAMHVKRFTVEAEEFADPDTQCVEYSEQDDCYYTTEGWYELIDNWPDYSSCAVIEGVVTHWIPLPAAPSAGSQGGDV